MSMNYCFVHLNLYDIIIDFSLYFIVVFQLYLLFIFQFNDAYILTFQSRGYGKIKVWIFSQRRL